MKDPRNILITGASSGIGAAMAETYARPGVALALSGRDSARLEAVAARCRELGADVEAVTIDVADWQAMAHWVEAFDNHHPLDLAHANAGVSSGTSGVAGASERSSRAAGDAVTARRMLEINIGGVMNTVFPAVNRMRSRGRGQIAIMSSLAAYLPLPGMAAYGASKAAVKTYGEALRLELRPLGIGVTVICPGLVRSRMTANVRQAPFQMDAPRAAALIKRRLESDPAIIAFPWPLHLLSWMFGTLPAGIRQPLVAFGARHV